jgi:cell division septal protein FtsQ
MFKRQSPVRNKAKQQARKRALDPHTKLIIKQCLIGFVVLAVLALTLTGIWYGTRITALTIDTVEVEGGETISHTLVQETVERGLDGMHARFIPYRFAWLYPETALVESVRSIPRVKDPQIERAGRTLLVTFDEYEPYALWCVDRSEASCWFIDDVGYAFTPAPKLTGGALLRFNTIGSEPEAGKTFLTPQDLATVMTFVSGIEAGFGFSVEAVETDSVGDAFFILAQGGELKVTLKAPIAETLSNLQAILASPEFADLTPGKFQYIDLRFGSKVFVNEEMGVATTSQATTTATTSERVE